MLYIRQIKKQAEVEVLPGSSLFEFEVEVEVAVEVGVEVGGVGVGLNQS